MTTPVSDDVRSVPILPFTKNRNLLCCSVWLSITGLYHFVKSYPQPYPHKKDTLIKGCRCLPKSLEESVSTFSLVSVAVAVSTIQGHRDTRGITQRLSYG